MWEYVIHAPTLASGVTRDQRAKPPNVGTFFFNYSNKCYLKASPRDKFAELTQHKFSAQIISRLTKQGEDDIKDTVTTVGPCFTSFSFTKNVVYGFTELKLCDLTKFLLQPDIIRRNFRWNALSSHAVMCQYTHRPATFWSKTACNLNIHIIERDFH